MKASDFRLLTEEELINKIKVSEENLFRLRCNKAVGQLEDTSAIKFARKDIARAKTVLNEKIRNERK